MTFSFLQLVLPLLAFLHTFPGVLFYFYLFLYFFSSTLLPLPQLLYIPFQYCSSCSSSLPMRSFPVLFLLLSNTSLSSILLPPPALLYIPFQYSFSSSSSPIHPFPVLFFLFLLSYTSISSILLPPLLSFLSQYSSFFSPFLYVLFQYYSFTFSVCVSSFSRTERNRYARVPQSQVGRWIYL